MNYEAWELYRIIGTQFVYDFHALPLVFNIYCPKWTQDEAKLMLNKLAIIHREFNKTEEEIEEELKEEKED